jgi:predicted phage tail protein
MSSTPNEAMAAAESVQTSIFKLGKDRTEAMLKMQKELLDTYDQASRVWLARIKSEADLWSELATKLAGTRSFPDAIQSYQECVSQRMKIAAEDAQRLSDEYGNIMQKFSRSMNNGWFSGST